MVKKLYIKTYGCQMNFADAERLKYIFEKNGWQITDNIDEALAIFAIGCSVRQHAENKIFSFIDGLKNIKKQGRVVGLLGCTANIYKKDILNQHSHINIICGTDYFDLLPEKIESALKGEKIILVEENQNPFVIKTNSKNSIYVDIPITKGCDNFCSYCVVPYARGKLKSRNSVEIINEIKNLSDSGVRHVNLLGQNVNEYGKDLNIKYDFAELLKEISKIDKLLRISFMTSHPKDTTKKILETMAENEKIMKHLHLPVQSGSNRILKLMNRKYSREEYLKIIEYARALIPDISITSDIMVGFPEETEKDFLETYEFVKEIQYDKIYIFKYSKRPFTRAAKLPNSISEKEKQRRHSLILNLQKKISRKISENYINKNVQILVEKINKNGYLEGKSLNNKTVYFSGDKNKIRSIIDVKIEQYSSGSYYAKL
jgi:tRNA-2-methylthio-N6-dimethylallyladenosine synthase